MRVTLRLFLTGLLCGLLASCVNTTSQHQSPRAPSTTSGISDAYVCLNPKQYAGTVVGDGHCVSLIKLCSKAPNTKHWRQGKQVLALASGSIRPGTIIATFEGGHYPSETGYHAAVYIRHDQDGIWVWDQWRGKPVHQRLIRSRDDGVTQNNRAQSYSIVVP